MEVINEEVSKSTLNIEQGYPKYQICSNKDIKKDKYHDY